MPNGKEYSGLKTIEQATEIRRRVLTAFEQAERNPNPTEQKRLLTSAVIGGGPTGVELVWKLIGDEPLHPSPKTSDRLMPPSHACC
ncbi:MAG: hypothetical protein R3C02_25915 [Planctomycetaceae bacterium]